jgi:hypothetical protein
MARGWLPANAWLQAQLITNVNLTQTCNAFYSPSNGTLNFYRSGGGCRNTGEIAAVFDHEWGHGMDDNDTGGVLSNSSEIYADIAAVLRLQASCVGYGFFQTIDQGCGPTTDGTGFNGNEAQVGAAHCNLDCSGVRGADWDKHADHRHADELHLSQMPIGLRSVREGALRKCAREPDGRTRLSRAWRLHSGARATRSSWPTGLLPGKCSDRKLETCPAPQRPRRHKRQMQARRGRRRRNLNAVLFAAFQPPRDACATPTVQNSECRWMTTVPNPSSRSAATPRSVLVRGRGAALPGPPPEGFGGCDFGKAVIARSGPTYDPDVATDVPKHVVQAVGSSAF